jgi:N-acetylglucosamine-6-phosphate deacetylase
VLDATGTRVVPGFVDLQCNGAFGIDLASEPERLWDLAALLPRTGVTAWLPTIVTGPPDARRRALGALRGGPPPALASTPLAVPLGLHLEGPFLAPLRRGAHPVRWLRLPPGPGDAVAPGAGTAGGPGGGPHSGAGAVPRGGEPRGGPDSDAGAVPRGRGPGGGPERRGSLAGEVAGWSAVAGVRLVTLAPELPGALDLVRRLVARGVVVAAGHSSATAVEAEAALAAGVRYVTHLFNAMAPLHHREPGLAGVALTDDRATVGLIADGVHVDPRVVRLAVAALGDRLSLVTDAVAAMGAASGEGRLGAAPLRSGDGGVRLGDGTLAGSTLALDGAVRNARAMAGLDLAAAVRAVTAVPAGLLGEGSRGAIAGGLRGDLVVLDHEGRVAATVIGGRVAYRRDAPDAPGPVARAE